jgi:glutaredoxin
MAALLENLKDVTDFHRYELDRHFSKQQFQMEFGGDASYPQIAINEKHIGNMNETLKYLKRLGMLDNQP